jgi:amino acid adenylation domain-containing protein
MLGVLKAGGAFLPLDPSWPVSRRSSLLADAGARVLLGIWDGEPEESLPPGCAALHLDRDEDSGRSDLSVSAAAVSPEQAAYVIYTSGSTGLPKGVMVGHGAAASFAVEVAARCGLSEGERFLQFASPGFDVLIEEVFPVWSRGGAVVFAPREELLTPAGLERVLERHGVTGLELPTPYWNEWMDDLERRGATPPRSVRRLLLGSEKPSVERLSRWDRHGVPVFHVFGLTETTVTSTLHRWDGSDPAGRELPIGRPVGNTWLYVLDREGTPVPSGVTGELFIGGLGVARGYLGRPALTAERFVPDPWSAVPGARAYRTGDRARYRADGRLDFLGRLDEQVKVRGFRVEPGEVAAVLEQHPSVSEAFVAVREARPGDLRLVAWVVPTAEWVVSREELRAYAGERLPEPMVPAEIVELAALPVTSNGKIDRAALPAPEWGIRSEGGEGPRTPVEELLAGIWGEVLGRESVGRKEDFFALGGHSLLATQVVSRVRGVLGVDLPLRTLFEAPTVAGLARAVEAGRGAVPPPPIMPVARDRALPLSFAQHRLWLIDQLDPGSATYNVPVGMRLGGEIDPALLARIFAEVTRRHEVLRTTFAVRDGGAVQVVAPAAPPDLPLIDLSHLPEAEREAAAHAVADAEGSRGFDLERGPLLRLLLVRLGACDHFLLITMHHIVSDGWSTGILIREVAALHAAFSQGQPSPLPELPVQYADFAVWQREWLRGEVLEAQLATWRERLAGAPQVLDLPTDRPRPAVQTFHGAVRPVALPADLSAAVRAVSQRDGATAFMTLLTAWAIVLGRHAGQDDLLLGAPVAGRNRQETEELIGFFVNTLVLRADLSGAPSFAETLRRVREASLEAFSHQDLPFERLVEEVAVRRDVARSPLIQVLFALENGFSDRLEIPGLALSPVGVDTHRARFELTLILEERPEGLTGTLEHSTDLFDATTIDRLAGRFQILLEAAVAAPETALAELPLLSEAEARQLLEWSSAKREIAAEETLDALFVARVRQDPGARAVTCEGIDLTYAELDARAENLARRLRQLGVGPEARVGLAAERSLDLIVGMLGIVKAGGAYLPLDPSYPRERLAYLIEDAGAQVLVGTEQTLGVLPPGGIKTPISIPESEGDPGSAGGPAGSLIGSKPADSAAYVIYTSGSTGKPKGVVVTHAAIVRLLRATEPWFNFGPQDVWTLFHSYAFDFSVWEIWGALLSGGRLVVVPYEVSRTPESFHSLLAAERVTVLNQTPTAFGELMRVDEDPARAGTLPDLRLVIFGGEALVPARLAGWLDRHGDEQPRLVNMYGITETTVHVTYRPLSAADVRSGQGSVIGIPIPDLAVHVLDRLDRGRLAPIGVPGEIAVGGVGGAGLARGYLGRPDLTAEHFVPDPFSGAPGARLYRSGDLGRFLPAGELESLGRIDQQVKIRGFRIEPGEIEAALLAHPDVQQAVVLPRAQDGGGSRLVAFVVFRSERRSEPSELRASLLGMLPEHQVPAAFVLLEALPLTANGKVDRKALLALEETPRTSIAEADGFMPPRTPAQELLADIWRQVLGKDRIGAQDNFFDLGGDSLLTLQVVGRSARAGLAVTPQLVFTFPVLADLAAAAVAAAVPGGPQAVQPAIGRAPRTRPLPLSFAQERLWFLDRLEPGRAAYNIPLALRVRGALSAPACAAALDRVVRRHEALRTTFVELDGRPVQVIAPPAAVPAPLPEVDLSALPAGRGGPEALRVVSGTSGVAAVPFDLDRGPLLRAVMVRLMPAKGGENAEHILLLVLHHIITDGWSLAILMREVAELLAAAPAGPPPPELAVQYADFAAAQRQWLAGRELERELEYWRGLLAGVPQQLELPADRSRLAGVPPPGQAAGLHILNLPAAVLARVSERARSAVVTPFMIYLAAFQVLLYRLTGQARLVIGTAVANRLRPEVEEIVGLFVNTLPLPSDLRDDPPLPALLARVREMTLGAFAHQQLPFERLVEALQPERNLEQTPVVQVMLVLQNATRPAFATGGADSLVVPGLSFEPFQVSGGAAKFDLALELVETAQGLEASWEYRPGLLEAATVARWAQGWANLLDGLTAQPPVAARASDLELLSPAERHQILAEWSLVTSRYPRDAAIHELFAVQAAAHPEAVALVALPAIHGEPVTVTYGELAAHAGRLSALLLSLGAALDTPVALCFERSPEMIAAILGVLQAGGAYAPLDPAQPPERMAAMLEDLWPVPEGGGPRLLLTSARHAPLFAGFAASGGRVVLYDEPPAAGPAVPALPADLGGDHLAYVMFTSGSTGRPKGVAVTHRGVVRLVFETSYAHFGPDEVWLQIAPVPFDASTLEIWGPLLHGGRLVQMPPGTPTLSELATILARHRVTTAHLTTGLFQQMVDEDLQALAPVRQLMSGGEAMSLPHALRVVRELPGSRFSNAYGPTESTTFSSCWPVWEGGIEGAIPIGRPIANTQMLVLDTAGRPAGIGVAGELVIGGDGLARGYVGRPDLTAERFRPHPVAGAGSQVAGERVYHTGDLVRFLPDGNLDFRGRLDRQVKIRGFRIEPAEIEAVLATLPGVAEAVVMAHREADGELRLLAFVTAAGGAEGAGGERLRPAALRRELRSRLPEAFVPAALWVVPALPLTANGKIDREALLRLGPLAPRGTADGFSVAVEATTARDPLEDLVAGIWCGVLGVERVGAEESFFDLGGHSLRATQVMSRLRQACGVELPLRLLFEAPTVAGLTTRLRAALISGQSGESDGGDGGSLEAWAAIPRRGSEVELPLSFAQERLWFLEQLMPGTSVYNLPAALVLDGQLDVAALDAALAELLRRHEGLRTVFPAREGRPWQLVLPPVPRPLPVVDLAALPAPARAAAAARLQSEEEQRGFDLTTGPLFRSCLLRVATGAGEETARHLLLLTLHHIVFDGWSTGVLTRELATLYSAALERVPSPLPELPIQYADFACWQRSWLTGANLERIVGYWRQHLTGVAPLRLPLDRPRPPLQAFSGDSYALDLSPATAAGVRRLARDQAVTPFMVGLAAFASLLLRYSGQRDFAVGTWVANRNRPELEGLIGFFVNNLALRLDLSGSPTFGRLLTQVREVALGAYAHQDLPFEKLVEDLKLPRDLSMPPVFQVICVQQPAAGRLELAEVGLEQLSSDINPAIVDLMLDLFDPASGAYTANLVYNRDLFDRATVIRFGHHFEHLLAAALEMESLPQGPPGVDELPLLAAAEAWQVAGEWSRGLPRPAAERLPRVAFVHQLVERWAALRPTAEAVVWPAEEDGERLTYGELNARANRLARCLRRRGVGPEVRVALWLPRSADLVVSALAALKAGGCYVPLDATYSGERLAFMAADARAGVLLTRGDAGGDREGFTPPPGAVVLRLDDPAVAAELAAESDADLPPDEVGLDPASLAYVIYTSGSTGRPKGTMIEHRSLLTAYYAYEQAYRLGEVATHLQMASFSFDVFTGDLTRALGSGARLVLCPREVLLDPARLYGLMLAERVEGAEFVPAVVRALVEHLERAGGSLDFMRLVVVSSDAWYAGEVESLARLCGPRTRLIDSYGVTEATIDTTFLPLAAGDGTPCLPVPPATAVVPIGKPLADNEAWVLGHGFDLLPARVPGELCIGGAGVARGYLDRPELTAEKFVPHPFSAVPGARLYRAGDLARWLPDGSVEFLGRVDNQIKVRGFRIEPGEIEAALGSHPQVQQAVVLALDAEPGRKQLVGYVVPPPSAALPDEADLRAFLKQRLPDYMVPGLFVPLDQLPLTPNGKVDRRALPIPDWSRELDRAGHQPPRTAAEEMLAGIWCEVLGVSRVGAFDDFFAIGGHSLLATQVVARLRAAVGVELPLRALFETPTLAELAQVIEEQLILQMDDLTDEELADLP